MRGIALEDVPVLTERDHYRQRALAAEAQVRWLEETVGDLLEAVDHLEGCLVDAASVAQADRDAALSVVRKFLPLADDLYAVFESTDTDMEIVRAMIATEDGAP